MSDILAKLNEELEQVSAQRATLRGKHKGDTMPEDARTEDQELTDRAMKIARGIEVEQQRIRDAEFEALQKYTSEPVMTIRHPVNTDGDGRAALMRAGWDLRNGMLVRETTAVKDGQRMVVSFCSEEVMFGAIPTDDPIAAEYYRKTRAIMQPSYRAAYSKWLTLCAKWQSPILGMLKLPPEMQNALSEGLDSAGGYLVPPDVQTEMLARLAQRSVFRQLARIVTTSRDRIVWPALQAKATSGSIYSSAFVGGWAGETPTFSDTDPIFEDFEVAVKKIRVGTKLSDDWISDASGNVMAFLAEDGANNMALVEENGFLTGKGTGLEPLGLLNLSLAGTLTSSSGIAIDVEGSTSNTISNTISSTGSAPKIQDLIYSLPSQYSPNASILMCRSIEGKTRKLVDANARPIWLGYNESGLGLTPRNIDGVPLYNSEFMPNDGTDTNQVYAYGDFRNYIIAERAAISTRVLTERFGDSDQTGIILSERVGGGAWNQDAFRIGIV